MSAVLLAIAGVNRMLVARLLEVKVGKVAIGILAAYEGDPVS